MIIGKSVCPKMDEKGTHHGWGCLAHTRLQMARVSICFVLSSTVFWRCIFCIVVDTEPHRSWQYIVH